MYRPNQIANYFITRYGSDHDITPMQLVKLVYLAHGWYLGATDKIPLIDENPQAWKWGPVVPQVYHSFKEYESSPIRKPTTSGITVTTEELPENIRLFLDALWNRYGKYSGIELSTLTHQEGTPWHVTWYELGGKEQMGKQISPTLIHEHYKAKLTRTA